MTYWCDGASYYEPSTPPPPLKIKKNELESLHPQNTWHLIQSNMFLKKLLIEAHKFLIHWPQQKHCLEMCKAKKIHIFFMNWKMWQVSWPKKYRGCKFSTQKYVGPPHLVYFKYTLVFWQNGHFLTKICTSPDKRNTFFINSNPHPPITVETGLGKKGRESEIWVWARLGQVIYTWEEVCFQVVLQLLSFLIVAYSSHLADEKGG